MSERKLATIRKIAAIDPIPEADAISVATVDGWKVVIANDQEYRVNDLVVYMEIDAWIPTDLAPFLSKGKEPREYLGVKGERLRTIKLKGQVSQGLILPLSILPKPLGFDFVSDNQIGEDVGNWLNIQKWEQQIPANLAGQVAGSFPSWGRKTDQERIENIKDVVFGSSEHYSIKDFSKWLEFDKIQPKEGQYIAVAVHGNVQFIHFTDRSMLDETTERWSPAYKDTHLQAKERKYEASLKLDGSSMSIYYKDGVVGVCSRNLELKINDENKDNAFIKTAISTKLLDILPEYGKNIMIQGELMGTGIQGNKENLKDFEFFVFDIFDIDKQEYLKPTDRIKTFDDLIVLGVLMNHVPILATNVTLEELGIVDVESSKVYVDRPSINAKIAEGVVFKAMDSDFSFKSINNKFLLKYE